jgi:hypothetical protein
MISPRLICDSCDCNRQKKWPGAGAAHSLAEAPWKMWFLGRKSMDVFGHVII